MTSDERAPYIERAGSSSAAGSHVSSTKSGASGVSKASTKYTTLGESIEMINEQEKVKKSAVKTMKQDIIEMLMKNTLQGLLKF